MDDFPTTEVQYISHKWMTRKWFSHLRGTKIYPKPGYDFQAPWVLQWSLPKFDGLERALVGKWKLISNWKKAVSHNPLQIEEKDRFTLITRIWGVYRKALIRLWYYSEIWYVVLFYMDLLTLLPQVHGLHEDKQCQKARWGHDYPKGGDGSWSTKVSLDLVSVDPCW